MGCGKNELAERAFLEVKKPVVGPVGASLLAMVVNDKCSFAG
jgi:hypothetical protein